MLRFDGRVVIVTGAGNGLGRGYALELARRGAFVVVNDLGTALDGHGRSLTGAQSVVDAIEREGGVGLASSVNVADEVGVAAMVERVMDRWGRIDVLINNAGIIRDKSFGKMTSADFFAVLDVHLIGAVNCTRAVWEVMRARNYGRIVMTTSISGLYGNFGQSNYSAAKMAVVGFMNTLQIEGRKHNIHINTISPGAFTRMAESVIDARHAEQMAKTMKPEYVTPAVIYLASEQAPQGTVLLASGRVISRAYIAETTGVLFDAKDLSAEAIAEHWDKIVDRNSIQIYESLRDREQRRFSHIELHD